jgi:hypothetical protein
MDSRARRIRQARDAGLFGTKNKESNDSPNIGVVRMLTEEQIEQAFRLFEVREELSDKTRNLIRKRCSDIPALRAFLMMRLEFIEERRSVLTKVVGCALELEEKTKSSRLQGDFERISREISSLRERADRLNPHVVKALELVSLAHEIAGHLRILTRSQNAIIRQIQEHAAKFEALKHYIGRHE